MRLAVLGCALLALAADFAAAAAAAAAAATAAASPAAPPPATAPAAAVFGHPLTAAQLLQGPLAVPAAALRNAKLMRGTFTYRKFLVERPQPLTSHGDFAFARELGVDWHTRQPFDSDLVLTPSGLTQRDEGRTTLQQSASAQPAVKVVARIFLALLSLDVASLQSSFDLSGVQQGAQWQVGLRPKVTALAGAFREAVLSGGAQVDKLVMWDANGDRSEISFGDLKYSAAISGDDRALFATPDQP
jgi:Outer membrane lipoprotein carrier protein LolA